MHEAYYKAVQTDQAFEAAIVKQFGRAATRWTVDPKLYDSETRAAYQAKLVADLENLKSLRAELA